MKDRRAEFLADVITQAKRPGVEFRKVLANGGIWCDRHYMIGVSAMRKHLEEHGRDIKTCWLAYILCAERAERGYDNE